MSLADSAASLVVSTADVGPLVIPDGLEDEQVIFLTDVFPTGYMAAEMATSGRARWWLCGAIRCCQRALQRVDHRRLYVVHRPVPRRLADESLAHRPHRPVPRAPEGYKIFNDKEDECLKIVLKTNWGGAGQ